MTRFSRHLNTYTPASDEALEVLDNLPPGNYIMHFPMMGSSYFERVDDFKLPDRIYGDVVRNSDRILSTFRDRRGATGVMLAGEKGSGKTLLAKHVAMNSGYPCILVNSALSGDGFNTMLQKLTQPAVVLFDEFEKVYDDRRHEQDTMLTLLDGVFTSKKLFLFTCNNIYQINENMKNRPGRIFYSIQFAGLDRDAIGEYCDDRLRNVSHKETIQGMSMLFREFNFDMLAALVEEMNRYDENPHDALKLLNIKPLTLCRIGKFEAKLLVGGVEVKIINPTDGMFSDNPAFDDDGFSLDGDIPRIDNDDEDDEDEPPPQNHRLRNRKNTTKLKPEYDTVYTHFGPNDLKAVDKNTETFTFVNDEGHTCIVTRAAVTSRGVFYDAF